MTTPPPSSPPTDSAAPANSRRGWLVGAALAAGAGLAGGVGWWQWQRPAAPQPIPEQLPEGFWAQVYPSPHGRPLVLSQFKGQPLVINFWATWCPPCVKELPMLDAFARRMKPKGWQVLGLAVDQPEAVQSFLQQTPVGFAMAMAGMTGLDLARQLGNDSGGLPFTVLVDAQGQVKTRRMGALREADLADWEHLLKG